MAVALRELERGHRRPQLRVVAAPPSTPRHVYWRRRLLVLVVVAGLVLSVAAGARALRPEPARPVVRTDLTVVVRPGQTLWDIAAQYAPDDAGMHEWVAEIAERNDVDGLTLQPGTALVIPIESEVVTARLQATAGR